MHPLYPSIKPYNTFQLPVGDEHVLYVEESGDIDGIPVLFIHGGPGAGCSPEDRRFFDPEKYRIILFDQRGAGRRVYRLGDQTMAPEKRALGIAASGTLAEPGGMT